MTWGVSPRTMARRSWPRPPVWPWWCPSAPPACRWWRPTRTWPRRSWAATRGYWEVRSFTFAKGGSLTESDERQGQGLRHRPDGRDKLFGNIDPSVAYVRIGKHAYRIIGMLEPRDTRRSARTRTTGCSCPSAACARRVRPDAPGRVQMLMASATDERTVAAPSGRSTLFCGSGTASARRRARFRCAHPGRVPHIAGGDLRHHDALLLGDRRAFRCWSAASGS